MKAEQRVDQAARLADNPPQFDRDDPPYTWQLERTIDLLESIAQSLVVIASVAATKTTITLPLPEDEDGTA